MMVHQCQTYRSFRDSLSSTFNHTLIKELITDTFIRAFHTPSDLLRELVKLSLYPTNQKSKIAAKYTASDGGSKSAQLAHVPDRKQASQADSEPPYEEVY